MAEDGGQVGNNRNRRGRHAGRRQKVGVLCTGEEFFVARLN